MKNNVNHDTCKQCKLCIDVCPTNYIGFNENKLIHFIPERAEICIECGQCMAVCTTDSIVISKYSYNEHFKPAPKNTIGPDQFSNFISSRRSVRNFKDQEVEKEVIEKLLDTLKYAPYGAQPNKVEITIVNKRQTIEKLLPPTEKFLNNIVKWVENPFIRRMIKRKNSAETFNTIVNHLYPIAKLDNYNLKYGDRITRGAPALLIFHAEKGAEEHTSNAMIYATYVMLAIHAMGLGASMNGIMPATINKVDEVR
ncbi:MAG: nitroreductase family protein, partial [Bacteroidales bacterium]|nr:nitroreductase family protein [Bacteroidales bacterium]